MTSQDKVSYIRAIKNDRLIQTSAKDLHRNNLLGEGKSAQKKKSGLRITSSPRGLKKKHGDKRGKDIEGKGPRATDFQPKGSEDLRKKKKSSEKKKGSDRGTRRIAAPE